MRQVAVAGSCHAYPISVIIGDSTFRRKYTAILESASDLVAEAHGGPQRFLVFFEAIHIVRGEKNGMGRRVYQHHLNPERLS